MKRLLVLLLIATSVDARVNTGRDSIRTSDGTSCESYHGTGSSVSFGARAVDNNDKSTGGSYDPYHQIRDQSEVYVEMSIPLSELSGADQKRRLDCSKMYSIELRRMELELRRLEIEVEQLEKFSSEDNMFGS